MSLNEIMSGLKTAVNSTIGDEKNFKPIDKMIEESSEKNQKTYLALKSDMDAISVRVTTAQSTADTAKSAADSANSTATLANNAANAAETNSQWRYNDALSKIDAKVNKVGNPSINSANKIHIYSGNGLTNELTTKYICMGYSNDMQQSGNYNGTDGMTNKCPVILGSKNILKNGYTNATHSPEIAIGNSNIVSNYAVAAIGRNNVNSGNTSYAIGEGNTVSGDSSIVVGFLNGVTKNNVNCFGYGLSAGWAGQTILGKYNVVKDTSSDYGSLIYGFAESSTTKTNLFRVTRTQGVFAAGVYNSSGADYAEYFEWQDGNKAKEDRVGLFVTLDGEMIKIANSDDDFILGIISGNPSVVGDSYDDQYKDMYQKDIYGRYIIGDIEIPEELNEYGEIISNSRVEKSPLINSNYNNNYKYIGRSQRSEWDCVGLLGKLVMRDDGTSKINEYVKSNDYGEATYSNEVTKFRVLSRLDKNHIKVLIM